MSHRSSCKDLASLAASFGSYSPFGVGCHDHLLFLRSSPQLFLCMFKRLPVPGTLCQPLEHPTRALASARLHLGRTVAARRIQPTGKSCSTLTGGFVPHPFSGRPTSGSRGLAKKNDCITNRKVYNLLEL